MENSNNFKHVEIIQSCSSNRVLMKNINNEIGAAGFDIEKENKIVLNKHEFKEFMHSNSNNFKILTLQSFQIKQPENAETFLYNPTDFSLRFVDKNKFTNLTSITYKSMVLPEEHLELLALGCTKLKKLCIDDCETIHGRKLFIGEHIQVSTLQKMKKLTCLKIQQTGLMGQAMMNIINLNIKRLTINVDSSKLDMHTMESLKENASPNSCKELTLGVFSYPMNEFNMELLNGFSNLQKLTLINEQKLEDESSDLLMFYPYKTIDEHFFIPLSEICYNLKYLKLMRFKITNFIPLDNLKELVLEECYCLTWKNFKQILCEMQLKYFTTIDTHYHTFTFDYFDISKTLEYLHVNNLEDYESKLFKMNIKNLRHLTTLIRDDCDAKTFYDIALKCPKLKTLKLPESSLLFEIRRGHLPYILELLKHPGANKLTILPSYPEQFNLNALQLALFELEDMEINVTRLNVPSTFFASNEVNNIWLNLIEKNRELKIMLSDFAYASEILFLKSIVHNLGFPKRVTSINICGFNIEVANLLANFEAATAAVKSFMSWGKERYIIL